MEIIQNFLQLDTHVERQGLINTESFQNKSHPWEVIKTVLADLARLFCIKCIDRTFSHVGVDLARCLYRVLMVICVTDPPFHCK